MHFFFHSIVLHMYYEYFIIHFLIDSLFRSEITIFTNNSSIICYDNFSDELDI